MPNALTKATMVTPDPSSGPILMKINSILLALDGSIFSRYAAECAWALAAQTGARLCVLHVVDSVTASAVIGHEHPGFLSKSDYVAENDAFSVAMTRLGSRLLDTYLREATAKGIESEALLEVGAPSAIICQQALNYDLVIIGHRPFREAPANSNHRQYLRFSVAETLAHGCPKPLIVVQDDLKKGWNNLSAMFSADHINHSYLNYTLDLAELLRITPTLACVYSGINEEPANDLVSDLRSSNPRLTDVEIALDFVSDGFPKDDATLWAHPEADFADWDSWHNTLLVAPTREIAGRRVTFSTCSPSMLVRYCSYPSVMLYPEDSPHLLDDPISAAASNTVLSSS
jgi:nucleotide-binding universal stress UspA family protein